VNELLELFVLLGLFFATFHFIVIPIRARYFLNRWAVIHRSHPGFYWGPYPGKDHPKHPGAIMRLKVVFWVWEVHFYTAEVIYGSGPW